MTDLNRYIVGFFESVTLFMGMYFFMQFIILKRREHLFYSLYLLALSIYYPLAMPDVFFNASLTNEKVVAGYDLFKRPIQFMVSLCYTFFVIYFLGLKQNCKKLYKIFWGLNILYASSSFVCLVLNYFQVNYNNWYFLISLLIFPIQIYVLIILYRQNLKYSAYIIWGSIIVVLGSLISLVNSIWLFKLPENLSQANADSYLPVQIAILIDIFLFSIALQQKIADTERSLLNAAQNRQQAILLERERIIADLHDDVGGGLSSIRMMSDLMSQQNVMSNPSKTSSFANKISDTAKEIAQRMHTIIWSLNIENDTLQNFAEYVRQYGVNFFEVSPVDFNCIGLEELPLNVQLSGVQRKNLFLIVKEAFHNILKHAHASTASVHISYDKNNLYLQVKDNGSGISNQNEFGNGLKNISKRMEEIRGNVEFITNAGTTINIFLPLQ